MSKIGQYIVDTIDHDDAYWQSHEFGEHEWDEPRAISAWYDLDKLPVDVKERLSKLGIEEYLLYDDVPF